MLDASKWRGQVEACTSCWETKKENYMKTKSTKAIELYFQSKTRLLNQSQNNCWQNLKISSIIKTSPVFKKIDKVLKINRNFVNGISTAELNFQFRFRLQSQRATSSAAC